MLNPRESVKGIWNERLLPVAGEGIRQRGTIWIRRGEASALCWDGLRRHGDTSDCQRKLFDHGTGGFNRSRAVCTKQGSVRGRPGREVRDGRARRRNDCFAEMERDAGPHVTIFSAEEPLFLASPDGGVAFFLVWGGFTWLRDPKSAPGADF